MELEQLLERAATDPGARPAFYRKLLESTLVVLGRFDGEALQLPQIQFDGQPALAIFTSLERLQAVTPPGTAYVGLRGQDFFNTVRATRVILNPGHAVGKELSPPECEALADGTIFGQLNPVNIKGGTKILMGQPAEYPTALRDALVTYFGQGSDVDAAYLAQVHIPTAELPPHPVVGIRLSPTARPFEQVMREVSMVASQVVAKGSPVDFIQVGVGESALEDYLAKTEPFYERR